MIEDTFENDLLLDHFLEKKDEEILQLKRKLEEITKVLSRMFWEFRSFEEFSLDQREKDIQRKKDIQQLWDLLFLE